MEGESVEKGPEAWNLPVGLYSKDCPYAIQKMAVIEKRLDFTFEPVMAL